MTYLKHFNDETDHANIMITISPQGSSDYCWTIFLFKVSRSLWVHTWMEALHLLQCYGLLWHQGVYLQEPIYTSWMHNKSMYLFVPHPNKTIVGYNWNQLFSPDPEPRPLRPFVLALCSSQAWQDWSSLLWPEPPNVSKIHIVSAASHIWVMWLSLQKFKLFHSLDDAQTKNTHSQ